MPPTQPHPAEDLPPGVQPPPSREHVDQVSKDQALIADEWAPAPPHPETVEPPSPP